MSKRVCNALRQRRLRGANVHFLLRRERATDRRELRRDRICGALPAPLLLTIVAPTAAAATAAAAAASETAPSSAAAVTPRAVRLRCCVICVPSRPHRCRWKELRELVAAAAAPERERLRVERDVGEFDNTHSFQSSPLQNYNHLIIALN